MEIDLNLFFLPCSCLSLFLFVSECAYLIRYVFKIVPQFSGKEKNKRNREQEQNKTKPAFFPLFFKNNSAWWKVIFKLSTCWEQAFSILIVTFLTSPARSDSKHSLPLRPSLKFSFESAALRIFRLWLCSFKCDSTVSNCMSFVFFLIFLYLLSRAYC